MSEWLQTWLRNFRDDAARQGFTEEVLGEVGAWPLVALTRETPGKPVVYFSAGMHGDEPAGVEALGEILRGGLLDDRFSWRLCPAINPTGLALGTRENAAGVDLNRDYLQAATEEVSLHRAWLDRVGPPAVFLSLHEDWESTGFYFYEIALAEGESCYPGIRAAAEKVMPIEPEPLIDDHETREPGWIFHPAVPDRMEEWPEAIYLAEQGCPLSFTLETPSSRLLAERVQCHVEVVRYLLEWSAKQN